MLYLWKQEQCSWFFGWRKTSNIASNWYYHFRYRWPAMPKLPKITSFLFLCNILREKWVMKLFFYMEIKMKLTYKLILWFFMKVAKYSQGPQNSKFAMSLQYLEKEVKDKVDFLHADKYQKFLQGDTTIFYKETLLLMMGMIRHS